MTLLERARPLLDRWFGPPGDPQREAARDIWFESSPDFDAALRAEFLLDHEDAAAGRLASWEAQPEGALALILLLDQVPRNIFRGGPRAYASDPLARAAAERALARGFDGAVPPVWRVFFYLPFEHSENLADQERGLALFAALPPRLDDPDSLRHARRHHEIIARFGRFPHRNAVLGRASTPAELAFLEEPDSSF
jgi:uncharacterized protein (DUF924 family)